MFVLPWNINVLKSDSAIRDPISSGQQTTVI